MRPFPDAALPGSALALTLLLAAGCGGEADGSSPGAAADAPASAGEARAPAPRTPAAASMPVEALETSEGPEHVVVYRSPTCGCCSGWAEHLEEEGFDVDVHDRTDLTAVKDMLGVPGRLRSCHTALVDGYLVEGHVPASTIRRLLEERPQIAGIAVPGMPIGSPGMEVPGREADPYDVLAFAGSGDVRVYEKH